MKTFILLALLVSLLGGAVARADQVAYDIRFQTTEGSDAPTGATYTYDTVTHTLSGFTFKLFGTTFDFGDQLNHTAGLDDVGGLGVVLGGESTWYGRSFPGTPDGPRYDLLVLRLSDQYAPDMKVYSPFDPAHRDGGSLEGTFQVIPVPEPGTLLLVGLGIAGLVAWKRRAG